ncbi:MULTISPECIES: S9 family peptidase [unclassified Carboxylicivirga]|uniref:S9 family peptidase n=1 Tax=Carboxylicivirga TaxID=1628153 RepID=UPI003D32571A
MRKIPLLLLLCVYTTSILAQRQTDWATWKMAGVQQLAKPAFADHKTVDNQEFKMSDLLTKTQIGEGQECNQLPSITVASDSLVPGINAPHQLTRLCAYISSDRYTKASLSVVSNGLFEVYLDGKKVKTQAAVAKQVVNTDLTLLQGKHHLMLKMLSADSTLTLATSLKATGDTTASIRWSLDPTRTMSINDVMNGDYVQSVQVSPSGRYALINEAEVLAGSGKNISTKRLYDLTKQSTLRLFRNGDLAGAQWLPSTDRISYTVKRDDVTDVYLYDVAANTEERVAAGLKNLGHLNWSPNEDYAIFSHADKADKAGDMKRIFGNDDRLPYFRTRYFLYKLDLDSKLVKRITFGHLSTSLHDISPDGKHLLFSTSQRDYTAVPFSRQNLYQMNINTLALDTLWKDKLYGGTCQYSPDGKQLLVSGSPEAFGELGVKVSTGHQPNVYDTQLYLFDLKTREARALTRDFDPAVKQASWHDENTIYLTATDEDYVKLYQYDLKKNRFTPYNLPVEVISRIDMAQKAPVALYKGTSINTPEQLYALNPKNSKSTRISFPKENLYKDIQLGKTEDWNFVNKNGTTIKGSVYYPPNYDAAKKYPVIVYYYGGTTPTSRTFGGRYPKNIWAAAGYMVYVLQPSGAIGFGQDFSSLHVNGWGRDAIDDIIDGTQQFLAAHPAADSENVGCIGASYGGFTTMTLQTRTDIFKTAISHAGISDITSYWGEGYWGYSYSAGATKNSYPWNRKDIYVENSPLFNADKFQNSILLLHGTADTNVPVGESLQFYAALKILDKEVEMVLIDGENHIIMNYHKRLKWHNTIMAWFDMKLKNQGEQWKTLYPDKNL